MTGLNPSGLGVNRTFNDTTHDSIDTDKLSNAKTVTPKPADDFQQFVTEHAGEVINLAGQTIELSQSVDPKDGTTFVNGTLTASSDKSDFFIVDTPDGSDYEEVEFHNVTFDGNAGTGAASRGVSMDDCRLTNFINCTWRNLQRVALSLNGKHSNGKEGNGPLISHCTFDGLGGNGSSIRIDPQRDYTKIVDTDIHDDNIRGIKIRGENTTVASCHITGTNNGEAVFIDGGDKTKLFNCTINHGAAGIRAVGVNEMHISELQALAFGGHAIELDGVQKSKVADVTIGASDSAHDCINLKSTNRSATKNHIENCTFGVRNAGSRHAINESDPGSTGNVIRQNVALSGETFNLNSSNTSGNVTL